MHPTHLVFRDTPDAPLSVEGDSFFAEADSNWEHTFKPAFTIHGRATSREHWILCGRQSTAEQFAAMGYGAIALSTFRHRPQLQIGRRTSDQKLTEILTTVLGSHIPPTEPHSGEVSAILEWDDYEANRDIAFVGALQSRFQLLTSINSTPQKHLARLAAHRKLSFEAICRETGTLSITSFCGEGEDPEPDWIIPGILHRNTPTGVLGPEKALKTSVTTDMAISIASGTRFLNEYEVPKPSPVLYLLGEGEAETNAGIVRRVVRNKGLAGKEIPMYINSKIRNIDEPAQLRKLEDLIKHTRAQVVVIDPCYLYFPAAQAENQMAQGTRFRDLQKVCSNQGATPVLVHHFKTFRRSYYGPGQLSMASWSGWKEWLGQWILLNRREKYDNSGTWKLHFSVGGRAGQNITRHLDITEGHVEGWEDKRTWDPRFPEARSRKASDDDLRTRILELLAENPGASAKALGAHREPRKKHLDALLAEGTIIRQEYRRGKYRHYLLGWVEPAGQPSAE